MLLETILVGIFCLLAGIVVGALWGAELHRRSFDIEWRNQLLAPNEKRDSTKTAF